jgi:hypothetical protein
MIHYSQLLLTSRMNDIVPLIHTSDTYGVFIETGCGVPVASALLSCQGASKTIYLTECPYSSLFCQNKYSINTLERAVSENYVDSIAKYYDSLMENSTINTIYVASFQIGDFNSLTTHGWIALKYKKSYQIYHITLRQAMSRQDYITRIGEIGVQLIARQNQSTKNDLVNYISELDLDIDIVKNGYTREIDLTRTLQLMPTKGLLYFDATGSLQLLENLCRDQKQLIVYKGSFNPPTLAHIELAIQTQKKYPEAKLTFMISIDTVDKGQIKVEDLTQRLQWLTQQLGYNCLVSQTGRFLDAISYFQATFPQLELIFPVGEDTKQRMEPQLFILPLVRIESYDRTAVSSTLARKALEDKDWDALSKLVPEPIFKLLQI